MVRPLLLVILSVLVVTPAVANEYYHRSEGGQKMQSS